MTCAVGDVCVIVNGGVPLCVPDASGDQGQLYDPCAWENACDPGLACVGAEVVAECDPQLGEGCCSPFCDVNAPNTCPGAGQECVAVYAESWDYDALKYIGICAIPLPP